MTKEEYFYDLQWESFSSTNCSYPLINCSSNVHEDGLTANLYSMLAPYYIIFILVFGIMGNCLSATVFMRTSLRAKTSSYYLTALALSDTGFLVGLLYEYFTLQFGYDTSRVEGECKVHQYATYVFTSLSTWIIVCFTVERFIAVQYPLQRPLICTVRRAKYIIAFTTLLAMLVNVVPLIVVSVDENGQCSLLCGYEDINAIYTMVDTVGTMVLPAVLIVAMNTMIAIRLTKYSKFYNLKQFRMTHFNSSISKGSKFRNKSVTTSITFNSSRKSSSDNNNSIIHSIGTTSGSRQRRNEGGCNNLLTHRSQRNVTKMLLMVSTVFIVLNLPSYSIRLFGAWVNPCSAILSTLQDYSMLLFYTNFAINFLLYSTCGVSFRRALLTLGRQKIRSKCAACGI